MNARRRYRFSAGITILFGLLCLASYSVSFWPYRSQPGVALLGLFVPLLMVVNCLLYLYWLIRKKKILFFPLLVLIIGYFTVGSVYQLNSTSEEVEDSFSLLSFNVRNFNKNGEIPEEGVDSLIIDFLREEDPDILCLQECLYSMKRSDVLPQYPHSFVDFIYSWEPQPIHVVQAVYSKYPLLNIQSIDFPGSANKAIAMDVIKGQDTLRLFNVHLQSFAIIPQVEKLKEEDSDRLFQRMGKVLIKQQEQAALLQAEIERSPYPVLVVGDFNNNQFSYAYRQIKGDLQDTYRQAGKGFGQTYNLWGFPMRIDFILTDPSIKTLSHSTYDQKMSDHFPIRAELLYQPKGQAQDKR